MKFHSWFICLLLTILLISTISYFNLQEIPQIPIYQGDLSFQSDLAFMYLTALVTNFPRRDYLKQHKLAAAEWIESELRATGLEVYTQDFSSVIASKDITSLRNIYALLPGKRKEAILIVGHYDLPPFVRQGAADNGSGVATLLELARIFASSPTPQWTMIFMASDCKEYGPMCGSYRFLEESGWKEHLAVAISLDFANLGEMEGIKINNTGLQKGYTPLWLRQIALNSITLETNALDSNPLREWLERAFPFAPTEHGIYLRSEIPAINLAGAPKSHAWQAEYHHTTGDTIEKILPETISHYGKASERLLRSLQLLTEFPQENMFYFKIGSHYLPAWVIRILQLLVLLPLFVRTLIAWKKGRHYTREIWLEIRHLFAIFCSGVFGYLLLRLLPKKGLLLKYELYPATLKDPVLNHPPILPLLLVVATIFISYGLLHHLLALGKEISLEARLGTDLTLLLIIVIANILLDSGFSSLAFLLPSLVFWPLLSPATTAPKKIINFLLLLVGISPFLIFFVLSFYISGKTSWQLLLATANGLFSLRTISSFILVISILIRFIPSALATNNNPNLSWGNKEEYFSWRTVLK